MLLLFWVFRYKQCYDEAVNLLKVEAGDKLKDDKVHGALLVLNELVRCSNAEWERKHEHLLQITDIKKHNDDYFSHFEKPTFFNKRLPQYFNITSSSSNVPIIESIVCRQLIKDNYDYICLDVLLQRFFLNPYLIVDISFLFRNSRSPYIQHILLTILPRLAAFNRECLVEKHLAQAMNYLLGMLKSREKDRASAFVTIGLVAVAVEEQIEPYMDRIMEVTSLPKKLIQK